MSSPSRSPSGTPARREARLRVSTFAALAAGALAVVAVIAVVRARRAHGASPADARVTRAETAPPANATAIPVTAGGELRVCADPNNLPYSNAQGEGLENRLAQIVARGLGAARVAYTWFPQQRAFLRETLDARRCDVVMGVPAGYERVRTTAPYYRSTYVFASRRERALGLRGFDDERLRTLRLGVQLVGDDGANTPPVHALSRRGIVENVRGFSVVGDPAREVPGGAVLDAVADGSLDVAIVWGPLAGYYVARRRAPFELVPVSPAREAGMPQTFAMSLGVRRGEVAFQRALDGVLAARRAEIDALLAEYGVPRI